MATDAARSKSFKDLQTATAATFAGAVMLLVVGAAFSWETIGAAVEGQADALQSLLFPLAGALMLVTLLWAWSCWRIWSEDRPGFRHGSDRERMALMAERTGNALLLLNPDGAISFVNQGFTKLTGFSLEEVLGKHPGAALCGKMHDARTIQQIREGITGQKHFAVELFSLHKDGHRFWLLLNISPVFDEEQDLVHFVAVGTDITVRKRAEEDLARVNRRNDVLLNSAGDGIYGIDNQGTITFINEAAARLTGWSPSELIGKPASLLHQLRSGRGLVSDATAHFQRKDGSQFSAEFTSNPAESSSAQIETVVVFRDVTTRRRAETSRLREAHQAALRADVAFALSGGDTLQSFLQRVTQALVKHLDATLARIWTLDPTENFLELQASAGLYTHTNGHHSRIPVGTLKVGLIAKNRTPDVTNDVANDPHILDKEWVKREQIHSFAGMPLCLEGGLVGVMAMFSRQPFAEDALASMGAIADVIAQGIMRKQAEHKVAEQAALLDQAHDAILVTDLEGHCTYLNKFAERLYAVSASDVRGRRADQALGVDRSYFEKARMAVLNQGEWNDDLCKVTVGGNALLIDTRWTLVRDEIGQPKSIMVVNTDISEKKEIEARFLRAQRLESIGKLASGIAHDLNNVLSPVAMSVELLKSKCTDDASRRTLSILEVSAKRGAEMVKQILTFSRGVEGERMILQTKHLIKEVAKIISETFPKNIQVHTAVPESLWTVVGDATQLHQVLMNLAVNARDAMPNGGTITFSAENTVVEANQEAVHGDATPGFYAVVKVADTGTGIPPEIGERIFEPFFTTKEEGKGSGLGLSTALSIVKNHDGFVRVQTEHNKGSQFSIYLPASEAAQAETQTGSELPSLPTGRGEYILAVDDEAAVLSLTKEILETYGYRVLTAKDGTEAIATFTAHRDQIRGVLTDMLMPHMDGPATIRVLKKLEPSLKIIAASGLMDSDKVRNTTGLTDLVFLMKPYTAEKLLGTIREALSQESGEALREK